ncbi:MAG: hypothetical protein KF819_35695 [Labilithrix sp.]|nr:hypothetical protein [Labilithrix sp.]
MTARSTWGEPAIAPGHEPSGPRPVVRRPSAEKEARSSIPANEAVSVQRALTVLAPLSPAKSRADLDRLLERIGQNIATQQDVDFGALKSVHFMRWVIVPAPRDDEGAPASEDSLVMSTNFDGELDAHLDELVTHAGPGFDAIFSFCEGYPLAGGKEASLAFLREHAVPHSTFYVGVVGRTRAQIVHEANLRRALEEYIDKTDLGSDPRAVADALRTYVTNAGLSQPPPKREVWPRRLGAFRRLVSVLPDLVRLLGSIGKFRELEETDEERPVDATREEMDHTEALVRNEDRGGLLQNQLSHVVDVKSDPLRLVTIRLVLGVIDFLANLIFDSGKLGDIPTIHFARWVLIEGAPSRRPAADGRAPTRSARVLFFSNFDGSWENYLGDFIDKAAKGLTSIWSNTVGFPRTYFLLWRGALDEQRFKTWTRAGQLPTQVWFSAYPELTLRNITDNMKIREGLFDEKGDLEWLRRL